MEAHMPRGGLASTETDGAPRHVHAVPPTGGTVTQLDPTTRAVPSIVPVVTDRAITQADWDRYEGYVAEILGALGLDLATPGTLDTPRRFLRALYDATDGYEGDPKLLTVFPTECHGGADCELAQVVEGPIPFSALCEHHALPFVGQAWVGYVAHERIIGISKLTRLVRVLTRRFGVQERMTHQIADSLEAMLGAHGTAVYLEAHHMCTRLRGVREPDLVTRTTAYRGVYANDPAMRAEFASLGAGRVVAG
jgi:GTP cyclohydrolase I